MKFSIEDITIEHNGHSVVVPKLHVWKCPKTGQILFDPDTNSGFRYQSAKDHLIKTHS